MASLLKISTDKPFTIYSYLLEPMLTLDNPALTMLNEPSISSHRYLTPPV